MVTKKERYEYLELRFTKSDDLQMKLWDYLEEQGKVIGKHNYIMQLIYEDYKKKSAKK
ncbi:hypothetical protein [Clostridium celatum]|uniref:Uncharacterized protein n=1 Tax=Clostridium celatum DSM 1785 TaxID=545697 RepID=L1QF64_9CLOT|nr:hypothetical protein [Clostridium celatum]EKY26591.1 hypothetical protein HMPREF0216_01776 [Clostridium celatum DSM 1785]